MGLDVREPLDRRAQRVLLDVQGPQDLQESKVNQAKLQIRELQAPRDLPDTSEQMVLQAPRDLPERQGLMVQLQIQARLVLRAEREQLDQREFKEVRV